MTTGTKKVLQLLRDLESAQIELQVCQRALLETIEGNGENVSDARKKVDAQSELVMAIIHSIGTALRSQTPDRKH